GPRLSCGSTYTASTRPCRASATARLAAVVVLPTPPLEEHTARRMAESVTYPCDARGRRADASAVRQRAARLRRRGSRCRRGGRCAIGRRYPVRRESRGG